MGDYELICSSIENKPGTWNSLMVEIHKKGKKLGEYKRNYSSFYNTFCPFTYKGQEYALYSKDYTSTRVMSLPDCKDLGGEERATGGFCPTDYYVPMDEDRDLESGIDGSFGFIAGCVWGDDSSWKIQYLDLSQVDKGIIKRKDRFGYIELPRGQRLKDAIDLGDFDRRWEDDFNSVEIAQPRRYTLDTGELNNWWEKETLKKLLIRAKEGTLNEVKRNPYYQPHTQWIYEVVKEVFKHAN